jgi:RNA 2',3'-cyclic 3'-phosphodiesterase
VAEGAQRLFVAVPLPPAAVADCAALIDTVRAGPLGGAPRWVHVPNLHLTVRFLGDTADDRVDGVSDAIDAALAGRDAFDVALSGAGSFPSGRKPRTLWLGIEHGTEALGGLAAAVDAAVVPLGWAPDARPYRPHLTVARMDALPIAQGTAVAQALADAATGWRTSFRAGEVVLFRSHLGGGPPRHERLLTVPLG